MQSVPKLGFEADNYLVKDMFPKPSTGVGGPRQGRNLKKLYGSPQRFPTHLIFQT
jgi:hypothetical protein